MCLTYKCNASIYIIILSILMSIPIIDSMKKGFTGMETFYQEIIAKFAVKIEKLAKRGEVDPSLPDILTDRLNHYLQNPHLIHSMVKREAEVKQEFEQGDIEEKSLGCATRTESAFEESLPEHPNLHKQSEPEEEDDTELFNNLERQKGKQEKDNDREEVKEQLTKIIPKDEALSCVKSGVESSNDSEDSEIEVYSREKERQEILMTKLRNSCSLTIYGTLDPNMPPKLKRRTKFRDTSLHLKLDQVYVRENSFPFREFLFNIPKVIVLKEQHPQEMKDILFKIEEEGI